MERREYFRIKDVLQLSLKVLPKGFPCPFSTYIYYPVLNLDLNSYTDRLDQDLLKVLLSIEKKLDAILQYLCIEKAGFLDMEYKEVDLSAGGIAFETERSLSPGDLVELKLILNTTPPTYTVFYAKVNRVEISKPGMNKVSMEFQNVGEELRSTMVKYVLGRQRQMLSGNR